jgi:hypothetical protein
MFRGGKCEPHLSQRIRKSAVRAFSSSEPLYEVKNVDTAGRCGMYNGFFISLIITIIVLVISLGMYYRLDPNDPQRKNKSPIIYISVTLFILICIWFGIPFLSSYFHKMKYKDYKRKIKSYEDQGFTRKQAIKIIQDIDVAESYARTTNRSRSQSNISGTGFSVNF